MPARRLSRLRLVRIWPLVLAVSLLAGCSSTGPKAPSAARTSTSGTRPALTTTQASTTTSTPATTTTILPTFSSVVDPVDAQQLGATWRAGCPVGPSQLRLLQLSYWGFDDQPHLGTIVVNTSVVPAVVQVFDTLYDARFPIEEMVPEAEYGGNDNAAAAADDTSGFNCRYAVAPGPPQWSVHAYGEAIDVNDVQNPYIDGSTIIPPAGSEYENRSDVRPGMAVPGGTLVDAFAAVGWLWGGRWTAAPDYQHFSSTGG
ncbi:MAG: M15 family metallopeptidase [Acidimicrobiales bacterium]